MTHKFHPTARKPNVKTYFEKTTGWEGDRLRWASEGKRRVSFVEITVQRPGVEESNDSEVM